MKTQVFVYDDVGGLIPLNGEVKKDGDKIIFNIEQLRFFTYTEPIEEVLRGQDDG